MFVLLWLDYFGANSLDDYAVKNLSNRTKTIVSPTQTSLQRDLGKILRLYTHRGFSLSQFLFSHCGSAVSVFGCVYACPIVLSNEHLGYIACQKMFSNICIFRNLCISTPQQFHRMKCFLLQLTNKQKHHICVCSRFCFCFLAFFFFFCSSVVPLGRCVTKGVELNVMLNCSSVMASV